MGIAALSVDCLSSARSACGNQAVKTDSPFGRPLTAAIIPGKAGIMWFVNLIPSKIFSLQARKPSGILGRYVMARVFNKGNADLNAFVMECLDLQVDDRVLEIGFGPGKLINEMANITTRGVVSGIDFSQAMIKLAEKLNKRHIVSGRVSLHEGECGSLPFESDAFDKLCTTNTLYFWKEPLNYLKEMFRVITPGGRIVIGFRDDRQMSKLNLSDDIFRLFSQDDVVTLLLEAGFSDAGIREKEGTPFTSYCGVGTKV